MYYSCSLLFRALGSLALLWQFSAASLGLLLGYGTRSLLFHYFYFFSRGRGKIVYYYNSLLGGTLPRSAASGRLLRGSFVSRSGLGF